jgi:hypothetical protein
MQLTGKARAVLMALLMVCLATPSAFAQITTGTIAGTVQDSQGGVIPGATVVLISESRGTRSVPAVTNATGDYVFPNMTPDTYTIEVTMPGFRTTRRAGVAVSGGDRVTVPALTIEPGGASETIEVTAEAPLIQAQSGERSFTVSSAQVDSLPLGGGRNFASLIAVVPGVAGGPNQNGARIGGASQDNIMMDGISAMDTGNNGQMIQMNIESIAEVKVLTSGYQAEYGRSSGLQITAVTKSGTNRFSGSLYDIEDNSDWNTNSWQNKENGSAKPLSKQRTWGYSIGGPVGRPGGDNKLFFFYSHEYRPSQAGGNLDRHRLPTALERVGDFSQSLDNNGRPIPQLKSPFTGQPYPNNVIPANELYAPGLAVLNMYPMPNLEQAASSSYNWESSRPVTKNLLQQPAVRVDYQFSPALRVTGKYSGQRERERVTPGSMPGFNDTLQPWPFITNYGVTVNYTLNPTTFFEATYGSIKNELAGGGNTSGGLLIGPAANKDTYLKDLPLIYPDAGVVDPRYYQMEALQRGVKAGAASFFDGTRVNLPQQFTWGGRVGSQPTNFAYPGWLNVNKTQDVALSLTKVAGRHTVKVGFYNNHSFKAQNVGAGGGASFQGNINFGDSTNNPLDTGFGFANAAVGVFTQYGQADKLMEGNMIYNNTEFYVQDNWKVTSRLTFDYGMRFTRQQPQHDTLQQMSSFFRDQFDPGAVPALYVPGTGNIPSNQAVNPRTGVSLGPGSQGFIGSIVPGTGQLVTLPSGAQAYANGLRQAGDGISKYGYVWPTLVFGPRFGFAYDLTGTQSMVFRGGAGLFYDRPDGNTIFSIPGNPPMATSTTIYNGLLSDLTNPDLPRVIGAPGLITFQYDAKVPSSWQWNAGIQMALPWASSLDVSYVGNRGYNRLGSFQGGTRQNLNQIPLGAAYLPGTTTVGPWGAYPTLLRPLQGYNSIEENATEFYDQFHSIQTSFNRRLRSGFSFGANYTYTIMLEGNTGLFRRLNADGSDRADWQAYQDLNKKLASQPHVFRGNLVWDLPDLVADGGAKRALGYILNDWQLSGVFNLSSGTNYDLSFSYQGQGSAVDLTGSPDYGNNGAGARVVFLGDPGSGCSSNQYRQFNTDVVTGPDRGSVGMESARNSMRGCMQRELDLSLSRNIRLGGGRALQLRLDTFNPLGIINYTGRQAQIQLNNPTSKTVVNEQFPNGQLDQTRVRPQNAGFGAVTSAQGYAAGGNGGGNYLRVVRLTARFSF